MWTMGCELTWGPWNKAGVSQWATGGTASGPDLSWPNPPDMGGGRRKAGYCLSLHLPHLGLGQLASGSSTGSLPSHIGWGPSHVCLHGEAVEILSYTIAQGPESLRPFLLEKEWASKAFLINPFLHFHMKWTEQHTFDLVIVIHCFLLHTDIVYRFFSQQYVVTFSQMNIK